MFYRPQFCCHCGEKIARAKWTPFTSRRFCDFCEIEQKQHELIPRVAMGIAMLFGAAGITAYFAGNGQQTPRPAVTVKSSSRSETPANDSIKPKADVTPSPSSTSPANIKQRDGDRNSSTEPVYYCGAMTKKGTPCTRRVKAKGRCWQHLGQPAAVVGRD
jgi:hypothetical protein